MKMDSAPHSQISIWVAVALLGITALAAGLRLTLIDRLPPGLSYDEAWNNFEALRIVARGVHPVYIVDERGEGEEPLHIYLIAALFALTGPQAIGGRVVSALLGTLTIPLLFLATREMLRAIPPKAESFQGKNDTIALLATFILATLYWHVHYTRLGMEPPTVPALATLTFWLLWRALNRGGWLDYGLAGAALGLSLYTHISARFLPIVVVLYVLWRWAGQISNLKSADWAWMRREISRFGLLVASALIIFAPLGSFFVQNPALFVYRAKQTSAVAFGGGLIQTLDNVVKVIGGLIWRGETNLRLNLPGRPGLDAIQLLLFVAGVVYSSKRERRRVLVFPLLWAGVMLLPSVFSDAAPHFGRMLGATPAIAILIALGCTQLLNIKYQISNFKVAQIGFVVLMAGALGFSTATMTRDYFVTWARDPGLYTAFDVGLRQSAEYLASLPRDELISLSPMSRDLPIFRFTFRDDVSRLKTFNGRRCAVYPVEPTSDWTHVTIVAEEQHSLDAIQRVFPSGQIVNKFWDAGTRYAVAYRVTKGTLARVPPEGRAVFDNRIVLAYFDMPPNAVFRAGDTLPITVSWTSRVPLDMSYTIFVHLSPALNAPPVAQEDAQPCDNSYPTTWWSPGEIIEENRRIVIPANALPGQYVLTTGIYDLATSKRLPVRSPGAPPSDKYVLGTVTVSR
jgi:Dolichyl-phosphate-mannose-protein mannosyltransferase